MTRFRIRPFRNGDPPALAGLWNRCQVGAVARPLSAHEFDDLVVGKLHFDPEGLLVAELDGRPAGFVHAGFGPVDPVGPDHALDTTMGAVAMLVVEPDEGPGAADALVAEAMAYLRRRGAQVLYAGGQYPLNPFYWGIYGGGEWAGILGSHPTFRRAAERAGFRPVATTILWEADLARQEPRDPKAAVLRRMARLEVGDDATLPRWWDALALGPFHITSYRLLDRVDGRPLGRGTTWDMPGFGRLDGRVHAGLIDVEVEPDRRHEGFGRHLVAEILRHARSQLTEIVSVQTPETNEAGLALYESVGFARAETATLYRLPAEPGSIRLDDTGEWPAPA